MNQNDLIKWLLNSDVSIQYQVYRDLLNTDRPDLKKKISKEGWGAKILSLRNANGHWGAGFYKPKWTSTHYTLLDLKNLCISNQHHDIQLTINKIIQENKANDGGINPHRGLAQSDVCINGMFLNYASYFMINENDLISIIDFILAQQMSDGGFNCMSNRRGAVHSSLHSTLSIIEGIHEYNQMGYAYRLNELNKAKEASQQFILEHKLFKSCKTGKIIDNKMLKLSYPSCWRYDILRALDYFQSAKVSFDKRMTDAIEILIKKRLPNNAWPLQAHHPGQIHFEMETVGKAGRWNTLRALRVLDYYGLTNEPVK